MKYYLYVIALSFLACNTPQESEVVASKTASSPSENYERSVSFYKYMEKFHKIDFSSIEGVAYVVILQDRICSACGSKTLDFIAKEVFEQFHAAPKYVFHSGKKEAVIQRAFAIIPDIQYHQYVFENIERYGLRYFFDVIFKLENGKITYWSMIGEKEEELKKIKMALAKTID